MSLIPVIVSTYLWLTLSVASGHEGQSYFKTKLKSKSFNETGSLEKVVLAVPGPFYFAGDRASSKPPSPYTNQYGSSDLKNDTWIRPSEVSSPSHNNFYYIDHDVEGRQDIFAPTASGFSAVEPGEGWAYKSPNKIPESVSYGFQTGDKDIDVYPLYEPPKSHQSLTLFHTPEYETITKTYWPPYLPTTPTYEVPTFQISTTPYFPYRPPTIPYTISPPTKYTTPTPFLNSTTTTLKPPTTMVPTYHTTTAPTTHRTTTAPSTHRTTPVPTTQHTTAVPTTLHTTTTRRTTVIPKMHVLSTIRSTTLRPTSPTVRLTTPKPVETTLKTTQSTTMRPMPTITTTTPAPTSEPPKMERIITTETPVRYETEPPINFGPGGITPPTMKTISSTPETSLPLRSTPPPTYGVPLTFPTTAASTTEAPAPGGYSNSYGNGAYGVPGETPGMPFHEVPMKSQPLASLTTTATPSYAPPVNYGSGFTARNTNYDHYQTPSTSERSPSIMNAPLPTYGAPAYYQTTVATTTLATPPSVSYNSHNTGAGAYGVPGHVPGNPLSEYVPAATARPQPATESTGSYGIPGQLPGEPLGEYEHTFQRRIQTNNQQESGVKLPNRVPSGQQQQLYTPALYFLPPPSPASPPRPSFQRPRRRQDFVTTTTEEPSLWSLLGLDD